METSGKIVWESIKSTLKESLSANEYDLWIKPLSCIDITKNTLELGAPDRYFCAWIRDRYLSRIMHHLQEMGFTKHEVRLTVGNAAILQIEDKQSGQLCLPGISKVPNKIRSLHPAYTFDQFMVGESNLLARSACGAIAKGERTYGNCLFINAATGLGKSHLTQAVVHSIMNEAPSTRMHYLTAQQFSAEMVQGIREKTMQRFSRKYLHECDLLLLEDIHTLGGKTKTQEELNNILDYLIKSGQRVVMTSARAPHLLDDIDEDFRSRMSSGLVTKINEPDYETRTAIVRHKARVNHLELDEELVDYMARHLHGDVRRTESAIIGIKARTTVQSSLPDLEMVKQVICNLIGKPTRLNAETIRDFVGCEFKVSVEELTSKSRKRAVAFPRQVAMFLTRKYTSDSLADIGGVYNRDHSTVLHAIKVITRDISTNYGTKEQVDILCRKLDRRSSNREE